MYLNRGLGQVSVFAGEGLESSETVPTTFAPAYCSSGMPDEGTSTCAPYAVFPTIAAAQGSQAMPAKVQSAMAAIQNAPCLSSLGSPDSNPGTPTPDEILQLAQQRAEGGGLLGTEAPLDEAAALHRRSCGVASPPSPAPDVPGPVRSG